MLSAPSDLPVKVDPAKLGRIARRLLAVLLVLLLLGYALWQLAGLLTDAFWFDSLGLGAVHRTMLGAQITMFVVFGGLMAAAVTASLVVVRRTRPRRMPDPETQKWRFRFVSHERSLRWWALAVLVGYFGLTTGARAAGQWQSLLLWRHAQPWGSSDPQFHRDVSYYLEIYPFHRLVVALLLRIVLVSLLVTVLAAYAYGGVRLRGTGPRATTAVKAQVSLLLGAYLLLQALSYWLDRFALETSNHGPVTGPSYTDIHALMPAKLVLMGVAVGCATLLLANVVVRGRALLVIPLLTMATAWVLVGVAWPAAFHRFREQPSAATLNLSQIARNQQATLAAYGLDHGVTTTAYDGTHPLHGKALAAQAERTAQIRVLDPNVVSPTFTVKQQLEAYYRFKQTLDIDRYPVDGTMRDVALAVRELNLTAIPRPTWGNTHLVYTHGYNVVAAPTDEMDATGSTPRFVNGGEPPRNAIPVTRTQVYFGQLLPAYSIVGQPPGSTKNVEFDHPGRGGSAGQTRTTYTGDGGVPVGSRFRRLLYAMTLHDPNILFSSGINESSQLLTVRDPRQRVAAVAPWLTLDGATYPVVADGHVYWVSDGYTTSATYPESQQVNLRGATSTTLTRAGSTVAQPARPVNYLRNSVKAVVDAYTGQVRLYEWNLTNQPDPLLKAWESAFPGLVRPESDIPDALLAHLRYPQDLFNVQRSVLASYHVTDAADFYNGSDFWKVPKDPTVTANGQLNSATPSAAAQPASPPTMPSVYMSLSPDGFGKAGFALSSPLVTLNERNLAAFLTVDSEPGPGYGAFTLLELPAGASVEAPGQIQNDIESSTDISEALTLQRGGNSTVVLGNLLTIPLGGRMLSVEPVYTKAAGGNSFPVLRHVIAVYGDGEPAFETSAEAAVSKALASGDQPG